MSTPGRWVKMDEYDEAVDVANEGRPVAASPPKSGAWWTLVNRNWVKRVERRGTMRGAARMTVMAEKRSKDRRSRKIACRGLACGARMKT
jgi:hypothetical protein